MQCLDNLFKKIKNFIISVQNDKNVYAINMDIAQNGLMINPYRYILKNEQKGIDKIEQIYNNALSLIPIYCQEGESRIKSEVLLWIAGELKFSPFVLENGAVGIYPYGKSLEEVTADIDSINRLLRKEFQAEIAIARANEAQVALLEKRFAEAWVFYVEEYGGWMENFMRELGDDISRWSFATYLQQRVKAYIFKACPVCYPVIPPARTAEWRKQREAASYDLPSLDGCRDDVRRFFYRDTFIYEQYAISGVIEARPGHTVVDAGAFIGDTACYFSRKVGVDGKIFAFEAVPESVVFAKENMYANQCGNVEIIPLALSDHQQTLTLSICPHSSSGSFVVGESSSRDASLVVAEAITLDAFVVERNVTVDFLKADIEGSEMAMLHGARKTIERDGPVCALSLYHKKDDFWQIPLYLAELRPDYTFWFRTEAEPVLFARIVR